VGIKGPESVGTVKGKGVLRCDNNFIELRAEIYF